MTAILILANEPVTIKLSEDQSVLIVDGSLNFKHVVKLRKLGKKLLMQQTQTVVNIDLQNVKRSDNSGLVLLIAWIRDARNAGKSVNYHHVPEFLRRMAQVFGLESILFHSL